MTPQEFKRLSGYSAARNFSPRFTKTTRRAAKSMGKKAQGRIMVPLERVFNHPSFAK